MLQLIAMAAEAEHEVNHALSWGIGAITLGILLGLMFILLAFAGGREHS
ncbi:hypothetical protein [Nocardioides bruguierae]|uniref:Uncharacterized protein n=1 Tax=Nocardioides bruguierae TaxID=2945102 RepID=A0A9X2IG16_9ACTN|nr:hypothetical protein [Nocardioides bruguierae]MCL8024708.1 hypothetical protein [Nocardioides bruguierae]MCM0621892.1 hypothetical protein [Nocardioides bruguierae]